MLDPDDVFSAMRGCQLFLIVCAMVCTLLSCIAPFFRLSEPSLHLAMEQTMWSTSVYTSFAQTTTPVDAFWSCGELITTFRLIEVLSILSILVAAVAFTLGVWHLALLLHMTNNYNVRSKMGVPILIVSVLALVLQSVVGVATGALYTRDWCVKGHRALPGEVAVGASDGGCNPWEGCILSFSAMGFRRMPGYYLVSFAIAGHLSSTVAAGVVWLYAAMGLGESTGAHLLGNGWRSPSY